MLTADCDRLNATFGRPGGVAFEVSPLGGIVARLTHGQNQVIVALQGAQVLSWLHQGREMLWLSPAARLGTGKAVRGGIPVCWPWFGPHPGDAAKPAHGFVRTREWDVGTTDCATARTQLRLSLATAPEDLNLWPHQAAVELTVRLDTGLSLALTTCNTGESAVAMTQALHTYFTVDDIATVLIEGLDGRTYIDKLDRGSRKVQAGAIGFDREVDRIYVGETGDVTLVDAVARWRLRIRSHCSRSTVVWNPWFEKTARLGDMGSNDAYRRMVCIETANAGDDVVTVAPGARHMLGVTYQVE